MSCCGFSIISEEEQWSQNFWTSTGTQTLGPEATLMRSGGRQPFTHQVCGPDSGFLHWSRSLWLLLTFLLLSSKRRASCSSKLRPQAATMVTKETTKISWNHQHGCWRLKFRVRVVQNYERENQFLRKHHQSNVPPPLWSHEVRTLVFSCSRKSRSYPEDPGRVFMAGFLWGCVVVKTLLINVSLLHSFTPPAERSSAAIKHTWIWIFFMFYKWLLTTFDQILLLLLN